jgi:cytochrome P450
VTTTELRPADLEATLLSLWSEQGGHTNPYPIYERLRTAAPVYFNPNLDAFFLTRYADIESVLTSPEFRTPDDRWADRTKPGWRDRPGLRFMHTSLLYRKRRQSHLDAPAHQPWIHHASGASPAGCHRGSGDSRP